MTDLSIPRKHIVVYAGSPDQNEDFYHFENISIEEAGKQALEKAMKDYDPADLTEWDETPEEPSIYCYMTSDSPIIHYLP